VIQSVIFKKRSWSSLSAREWLRSNGYKSEALEETANTFRFRQTMPNFKRYRIKNIGHHIALVLGFRK
jgi:hypothetical protein